ncbi:MAG: ABC transporter substrate-binding protein [Defluviitaleaceae bacterium]|nr:ABC transporter substrate-binding protein [Defluviitaleaceae bacterium]
MKRVKFFSVSVLFAGILFLSACGTPDPDPVTPPPAPPTNGAAAVAPPEAEAGTLSGTLRVASFTNEALIWATAFRGAHPDIEIDFTEITMEGGHYQEWLFNTLVTGVDVPDVVFLEAEFIRMFVETPFLADLSHLLPEAHAINMFPFIIDAGMYQGQAKAFSWQATPGAMFYRRSLALDYFGTDDPVAIQALFADLDTTLDSFRTIRDLSEGRTFGTGSANEFFRGFGANRAQPWVVNDTLTIDPLMFEFIDFARIIEEEGLHGNANQWSASWFQAMNDNLDDAFGNPVQVFSYFLPSWGLTYVLMNNVPDPSEGVPTTFGDWGLIPGPVPYQWGGTWAAATTAGNQELAAEFIRWIALNEYNQMRWATGVFDNAYLTAIDPAFPSGIGRGPGDFVSSQNVVEQISDTFVGGLAYEFLGGQNPYATFGQLAPNISLALMQGTDAAIGDQWQDAVGSYLDGELGSVEEILASFQAAVSVQLPHITIP